MPPFTMSLSCELHSNDGLWGRRRKQAGRVSVCGLQGVSRKWNNTEVFTSSTGYFALACEVELDSLYLATVFSTHTLAVDPTWLPGPKHEQGERRVAKASSSRSPPASHRGLHLETDKVLPTRGIGHCQRVEESDRKSRMFLK